MRALISIGSWIEAAYKGYPQAQRDTWLKGISNFKSLDYRFFYGDNKPTGEDESVLNWSYEYLCIPFHGNKYAYNFSDKIFIPAQDEVVLENLPDDHRHNSFKTKRALQWSLDHGYDYTFICGVDTYVCLDRLINSGFENWDYTGTDQWNPRFAGGGPGYWLSARSAQHVVNSPVVLPTNRFGGCEYVWAEDTWVGGVMGDAAVELHPDRRYKEWPFSPFSNNDCISSHLGVAQFTTGRMVEAHFNRFRQSTPLLPRRQSP